MALSIRRADLTSPAAHVLITALNAELSGAYPEPGATHFGLDPADIAPERGAFLVAYLDGEAVGCGAMRLLDATTGELKRMYVTPAFRGNGVGRRLVEELEAEARRIGAERLVLETGARQAAALLLYERCGFTSIPLYGEYLRSPESSICLGKTL